MSQQKMTEQELAQLIANALDEQRAVRAGTLSVSAVNLIVDGKAEYSLLALTRAILAQADVRRKDKHA